MNAAFWADLDARIAREQAVPSPTDGNRPMSAPSPAAHPEAPSGSSAAPAADWSRVLDTLSAATVAAEERDQRLSRQSDACEKLSADLQSARQEIRTLRTRLEDVQGEAETRLRAIQLLADSRVHDAEERARAAHERAEAAEGWLARIEQASRDLLPPGRHAAA